MPPVISVRWSPPNAPEMIAANMQQAPQWMPRIISRHARHIGAAGVDAMRDTTDPNRYTGALGESISATYEAGDTLIKVSPKAMRGQWDAGSILELGTRPIPRAPYAPIRRWADFRGAPMPGAWLKIRRAGVSAHPFLDRTLQAVLPDLTPILGELLEDVGLNFLMVRG